MFKNNCITACRFKTNKQKKQQLRILTVKFTSSNLIAPVDLLYNQQRKTDFKKAFSQLCMDPIDI